jgi:hypothetical protein
MGSSESGIAAIVAGTIIVSAVITIVTGGTLHWPFVLLGIVVGLMAVASINGR